MSAKLHIPAQARRQHDLDKISAKEKEAFAAVFQRAVPTATRLCQSNRWGAPRSARHFGPTVVVLVYADTLAVRNLVQEPCGNNLSRRVLQPFDFIE